jgi:outer membrane protein assembly factor BamB
VANNSPTKRGKHLRGFDPRLIMSKAVSLTISARGTNLRRVFAFAVALFFAATLAGRNLVVADSAKQISLAQPLTVKWHYASEQTTDLTPATDGSKIYLPLTGGKIVALNAVDGQLSWTADAGGELSTSPSADGRTVFIATQYDELIGDVHRPHGVLRALSAETGVTLWMRTLQAPLRGGLAVGTNAIFSGGVDGRAYAFDKNTGLTLWATQYSAPFSSQPQLSADHLYLGSEDGTLLAFDQKTGQIIWSYHTKGPIRGPVAAIQGLVYFGSGDGSAYAFDEVHGELAWHRRTGAGVQSVAAVDGGLLVASLDNFVYCFSLRNGNHLWRRQLAGRIAAPPVTASDGALFTPLSSDSAVVLSLRDGKPVNTLPVGEENIRSSAPIIAAQQVVLTTSHGLLVFSGPKAKP